MTDALLNFETVKYFTNEDMEVQNLSRAIAAYQKSERALMVSLNVLNVVQALILFAGISTGMTVCVHEVVRGNLSVGDSVLFLTLMSQVPPLLQIIIITIDQGLLHACGYLLLRTAGHMCCELV